LGLTTPHSNTLIVTKVEKRKSWMDLTMMERVGDRWGKNGRILLDRPKPTVGCSANGRRFMLCDLSIWLDVCSFEWELGSWDSVEGGLE
jgi:hypothetical protein